MLNCNKDQHEIFWEYLHAVGLLYKRSLCFGLNDNRLRLERFGVEIAVNVQTDITVYRFPVS
jgi:hypothetical protein